MSLKAKVEQAFAAVIATIDGVPEYIRKGADSEELLLPCAIAWCRGGPEEPQGSGNRRMRVTIIVRSEGDKETDLDDPETTHDAYVKAVFEGLKVDNLAALLTAAVDDFTAFDPVVDTGADPGIEGRAFQDTLDLEVYCCASDIA